MSNLADIEIHDLADSMQPFAEFFGIEATQELIARFGGTEIYVPMVCRDGHALDILGRELADKVCNKFGGATLLVPKELMTPEAKQRRAIELTGKGHTKADIARALNLTERHVYKLLRAVPRGQRHRRLTDPRQISLLTLIGDE